MADDLEPSRGISSIAKIDQLAFVALVAAVVAIGISSWVVGSVTRDMHHLGEKVDHLEESYDLLQVRYANQTAWLKARQIEVPE